MQHKNWKNAAQNEAAYLFVLVFFIMLSDCIAYQTLLQRSVYNYAYSKLKCNGEKPLRNSSKLFLNTAPRGNISRRTPRNVSVKTLQSHRVMF